MEVSSLLPQLETDQHVDNWKQVYRMWLVHYSDLFNFVLGEVGEYWSRRHSWWQWAFDFGSDLDDYTSIPNSRHFLPGMT